MAHNGSQSQQWRRNGYSSPPGPKPGQRHAGQFRKGFDPRRNLNGQPRRTPEVKAIEAECREHAQEAVSLLRQIMADPDAPTAQRLAAAREILDRGHGKPVDRSVLLNLNGDSGSDPDLMSDAALMRIAAGGDTGKLPRIQAVTVDGECDDTPPSDLK